MSEVISNSLRYNGTMVTVRERGKVVTLTLLLHEVRDERPRAKKLWTCNMAYQDISRTWISRVS